MSKGIRRCHVSAPNPALVGIWQQTRTSCMICPPGQHSMHATHLGVAAVRHSGAQVGGDELHGVQRRGVCVAGGWAPVGLSEESRMDMCNERCITLPAALGSAEEQGRSGKCGGGTACASPVSGVLMVLT